MTDDLLGLADWLALFPHWCSEQVVSAAMPGVLLSAHPDLAPERHVLLRRRPAVGEERVAVEIGRDVHTNIKSPIAGGYNRSS